VNDNGSAVCAHWEQAVCPECRGQTRRQSLAETAMGTFLSHYQPDHIPIGEWPDYYSTVALASYSAADAMLAEEKRREEEQG